jgi:hypothetical protein
MLDEYCLDDLRRDHLIRAKIFIPFAITRLRTAASESETILTVRLRNLSQAGEQQRQLRITWSPADLPVQPLGIQERTVTEWAACGVACAVVALYAGLRIREVTMTGDRFDYWVTDGEREYGLEVSGTLTQEVEARHRAKREQLLENPYGVDGYVVVVGFATQEVILSFHRFEEEAA